MRKESVNLFLLVLLCLGCAESPPSAPAKAEAQVVRRTVAAPPVEVEVDIDYLMGKFDPAAHPDFVAVGVPYSQKPQMWLRKEAFEAFKQMYTAAKKEGVTLNIISATRNFYRQKEIWEGKWSRFAKEAPAPVDRALKILEYSSMPGSSRHHWGTDMDLNDLTNEVFEKGGKHEKVYLWLLEHASEFGFCQPYTAGRPHGYREEKWHWSYTPLSKGFLSDYRKGITNSRFSGFQGAELADSLHIVEHYVGGIQEICQ